MQRPTDADLPERRWKPLAVESGTRRGSVGVIRYCPSKDRFRGPTREVEFRRGFRLDMMEEEMCLLAVMGVGTDGF